MIEYAENAMPNFYNKRRFVLFGFQEVFINELKKRDYEKIDEYCDTAFDFINELPEFFISQIHQRMKAHGAEHMTGGANKFYRKIGYAKSYTRSFRKKNIKQAYGRTPAFCLFVCQKRLLHFVQRKEAHNSYSELLCALFAVVWICF